eukprot:1488131-Ditylum_brightwellii.AAC.1
MSVASPITDNKTTTKTQTQQERKRASRSRDNGTFFPEAPSSHLEIFNALFQDWMGAIASCI